MNTVFCQFCNAREYNVCLELPHLNSIQFKLCVLCYNALNNISDEYKTTVLTAYTHRANNGWDSYLRQELYTIAYEKDIKQHEHF